MFTGDVLLLVRNCIKTLKHLTFDLFIHVRQSLRILRVYQENLKNKKRLKCIQVSYDENAKWWQMAMSRICFCRTRRARNANFCVFFFFCMSISIYNWLTLFVGCHDKEHFVVKIIACCHLKILNFITETATPRTRLLIVIAFSGACHKISIFPNHQDILYRKILL